MGKTISDWIIKARKIKGLENLALSLDSEKRKDLRRLKDSGLPIFEEFSLPLEAFNYCNADLQEFMSRHELFFIRALPKSSSLPRRFKVDVTSFKECEDFLHDEVPKKNRLDYTISLSGKEPNHRCGAIICRGEGEALIEIANGGLDKFSHGRIRPSVIGEMHFGRMRYFRYTKEGRESMDSDKPEDMNQRAPGQLHRGFLSA